MQSILQGTFGNSIQYVTGKYIQIRCIIIENYNAQ